MAAAGQILPDDRGKKPARDSVIVAPEFQTYQGRLRAIQPHQSRGLADFRSDLNVNGWTKTPSIPRQRIMAVPIGGRGLAFARGSIHFAGKASQALLNLSDSKPDIRTSHLIDE